MLIIYFKSDGEIHQVASEYRSLKEFYGIRYKEFSLIFDAIFIENYNDYLFNNYYEFEIKNKTLMAKENSFINFLGGNHESRK